MRQVLGFGRAVGFVGVLGGWLVACGSEQAPDSSVTVAEGGGTGGGGSSGLVLVGGTGGASGSSATAGSGGSAGGASGTTGTGGGSSGPDTPAPGITLHACPAQPDPPCPALVLPGDVVANDEAAVAALEGVTAVEGQLRLSVRTTVDALSCLESVGDDLEIDVFGADNDVSLWGLRNLKTVAGSIDINSSFDRVYADCGLSRVESLGEKYATGGAIDTSGALAGELDLSKLKLVRHIRLRNSELSRVVLPSNVTLTMGQLLFDKHPYLTEISGFSGVTIESASTLGSYSVRIVDNPFLSTCRASELARLFIAGGTPENTVTIMNNAPCAM